MFDISWSEFAIIAVVALIAIGPKELPGVLRMVGQWMGKARRMAGAFRKSFDDMARQSELDELRKEIGNLRAERPLAGLERDMHQKVAPDEKKPKSAAPQRSETAPRESMAATDGYKPPAP